jgi:hypothetical protein
VDASILRHCRADRIARSCAGPGRHARQDPEMKANDVMRIGRSRIAPPRSRHRQSIALARELFHELDDQNRVLALSISITSPT